MVRMRLVFPADCYSVAELAASLAELAAILGEPEGLPRRGQQVEPQQC
jgi:hypothetical protein